MEPGRICDLRQFLYECGILLNTVFLETLEKNGNAKAAIRRWKVLVCWATRLYLCHMNIAIFTEEIDIKAIILAQSIEEKHVVTWIEITLRSG